MLSQAPVTTHLASPLTRQARKKGDVVFPYVVDLMHEVASDGGSVWSDLSEVGTKGTPGTILSRRQHTTTRTFSRVYCRYVSLPGLLILPHTFVVLTQQNTRAILRHRVTHYALPHSLGPKNSLFYPVFVFFESHQHYKTCSLLRSMFFQALIFHTNEFLLFSLSLFHVIQFLLYFPVIYFLLSSHVFQNIHSVTLYILSQNLYLMSMASRTGLILL